MSSPSTFNLIDEPWLVVRNVRGDTETVSMRDIFHRSTDLKSLSGELPSQDFAVLRILLAVMYRALLSTLPDDPEETWGEWWRASELPLAQIDAYLDRWHGRFDLVDPKQPFFQVADLQTTSGEIKSVELLVPDSPSNTLFAGRRSYESLSLAEAARWLVHCQAYDISGIKSGAVGDDRVKGGKGYPIGQGFAGWLGGITVVGNNLRETLLLNLVADREDLDDDLPIWEQPPLTAEARLAVDSTGQVSLSTWPQRRIRLFPDDDRRIIGVIISNGDPVQYQYQNKHETMTGWRRSDAQTKNLKSPTPIYMPREFEPGTQVWRGLDALLPIAEGGGNEAYKPCRVIEWVQGLANGGELPDDGFIHISTVGVVYGPQNASWDEVFSDHLDFHVQLATTQRTDAKEVVEEAVRRAKNGAQAVVNLAANLETAAGGDQETVRDQARALAFAALDIPFREWLATFTPRSDGDEQLQEWTDNARRILNDVGQQLITDAGPKAWVGRVENDRIYNTGQAAVWFSIGLNKAFPSTKNKENSHGTIK